MEKRHTTRTPTTGETPTTTGETPTTTGETPTTTGETPTTTGETPTTTGETPALAQAGVVPEDPATGENNCDPSYPDNCIPPKTSEPDSDLNCEDTPNRDFKTSSDDPHDFDRDEDGIGCESGNNDDAIDEEINCDPSYPDNCIPPKTSEPDSDLNCEDTPNRDFNVSPNDPHDFDRDGDGKGCESGNNDDGVIGENNCDPSYPDNCIPPKTSEPDSDLNCENIPYRNFKVSSSDPHDFDGDEDGKGCESGNNDDYNGGDDYDKPKWRDRDVYHYTKVIINKSSKCNTQSDSVLFTEKLGARTPVLVADFYPCELKDGRAILNLPNNPNLELVVMHLDRNGKDQEGIAVDMKKIQSLKGNNALYMVDFDDEMEGENPITGKTKTLKDINAIALFNKSENTIDFKSGNSLAISAILKS